MADFNDVIKAIKEASDVNSKSLGSLETKVDALTNLQKNPVASAADAETARDAKFAQKEQLNALKAIADSVSSTSPLAAASSKQGGFLAGIGGALGTAGIGVGVAAGGIGALLAGGGYLLDRIANFDGKKVVANVKELMKIADLTDGVGDAFSKGGSFIAVMGGLGIGLAALGIGAAITGISEAVNKFAGVEDWAQRTVDNVKTLMTIPTLLGGNEKALKDGGTFFLIMSGLGTSLAAFGFGSATVAISNAIAKFTGETDWAKTTVANVKTLMTIPKLLGGNLEALKDGGTFFLIMTGMGLGLAAFGFGSAVASTATAIAKFTGETGWAETTVANVATLMKIPALIPKDSSAFAEAGSFVTIMGGIMLGLVAFAVGQAASNAVTALNVFSGGKRNFADAIVYNVKKLMEITDIKFKKIVGFVATMGAISAGLVAFAVGKGANVVGDALSKFTGNFADNVVKDVKALLQMVNDQTITVDKAEIFKQSLTRIAAGLGALAGGNLASSLKGAASKLVNFISGNESPIQKVKDLAQESDSLVKGAGAIERIANSLSQMSSLEFSGSNIDIKDFVEKLEDSMPKIERIIMGGKKFKGLASPEIKFKEASDNISRLFSALGVTKAAPTEAPITPSGGQSAKNMTVENLRVQVANIMDQRNAPGGGDTNVVNAPVSSVNASKTITTGGPDRILSAEEAAGIRGAGK